MHRALRHTALHLLRHPLRARAAVLVVATALASTLLGAVSAAPAPAASGIAVPAAFFGVHDRDPSTWPNARVGAVRLWDNGVSWRQIETTPDTTPDLWSWDRLDAAVAAARAHRAEVTLVLGQTPDFHVAAGETVLPACGGGVVQDCARYGAGATSAPDEAAYETYVKAVADRYGRQIAAVQVWNEGNVPGFWSGTPEQLARLTFLAHRAVAGTGIKVVAPSFVARGNKTPIRAYFAAVPNKQWAPRTRTAGYVDAVAFSLYPRTSAKDPLYANPERSVYDGWYGLAAMKKILAAYRVTKPIWNTEINYGLAIGGTGAAPKAIGSARQASYVVRTYLLFANARVQRTFWYAWDLRGIANTTLSYASGRATPAGKAFDVVRSWLTGVRVVSCSRDRQGTYTCLLRYAKGVKRIYWNPSKRVRVTLPGTATYKQVMSTRSTRVRGGSRIAVDYHPVLVRSKR